MKRRINELKRKLREYKFSHVSKRKFEERRNRVTAELASNLKAEPYPYYADQPN